ncbi:MAG: hypothetical protein K9H26_02710 [Prolixibacteraceae bacterium]|nr:hypothetical protein [Prolixibacteraceae bacterium]
MKNLKIYLVMTLLSFSAVVFNSCSNEDELINSNDLKIEECPNILYFENAEEISNELSYVLTLNTEEKIKWQEEKGFKSLGVEAEKFYSTINPNEFCSKEEIERFVKKNRKYLQITSDEGEQTVEPVFSANPYRFLINEDQLFQIGENVIKILQNGYVAGHESKIDKIKVINDNNMEQFNQDEDLKVYEKETILKSAGDCDDGESAFSERIFSTGGNWYRTYIKVEPRYVDDFFIGSLAQSYYKAGCQILNMFWWWHRTRIYTNVSTQMVYNFPSGGLILSRTVDTYENTSFANVFPFIERFSNYQASITTGFDPNPYFNSYHAECHSDAHVGPNGEGKVIIDCD